MQCPCTPCRAVPVCTVRDDDENTAAGYLAEHERVTGLKPDRFARAAAAQCENSAGLPLGVQLLAPQYHDEIVLRAMHDLEAQLPENGETINRSLHDL